MCRNLQYHFTPATLHPAAGPFCQSELRAVRQNLPDPAKLRTASSWKSWIFAALPKPDRAVTVKGVGGEVDTGPMTVVTSPQLYKMAILFLPSASFHFCLFSSSITFCRYNTLPP